MSPDDETDGGSPPPHGDDGSVKSVEDDVEVRRRSPPRIDRRKKRPRSVDDNMVQRVPKMPTLTNDPAELQRSREHLEVWRRETARRFKLPCAKG